MKFFVLIIGFVTFLLADIGKVTVTKGETKLNRDSIVMKIHNDLVLKKQDIVQTYQGRLQMYFNDNTVVSLGRESRFIIQEYIYNKNNKKLVANFKIEKGFMKTITGLIGKLSPELFVVETATTLVTPNGTIWSVEVNESSEEYTVLEGKITLSFKDSSRKNLELHSGEVARLNLSSNGAKKKIESIQKIKLNKEKDIQVSNAYESKIEDSIANAKEEQGINEGTVIDSSGTLINTIDDGNNGHGNDPGKFDPSNPGRGNSAPVNER